MNFAEQRTPQRQAIIDADEFIQQCQEGGQNPQQVFNSLVGDMVSWRDVRKLVIGEMVTKLFD